MRSAEHIQSIYAFNGKGGAYELRCESCYSWARGFQIVGGVVFIVMLIYFLCRLFKYFVEAEKHEREIPGLISDPKRGAPP